MLGFLYERGYGVAQDFTKARELWEKANSKGNTLAMANLGELFANGRGVPQDYAKALDWFERAVAKGNTLAMTALGAFYRDGKGVKARLGSLRASFPLFGLRG